MADLTRLENSLDGNSEVTTLTLFGYDSARTKLWAFGQMGFAGRSLTRTKGLKFFKLLGSGSGGGFSLQPDWARYGLLCVWENERSAAKFFANSAIIKQFRRRAREIWTVRLAAVKSHGAWSGQNPFVPLANLSTDGKPLAVLTRATINFKKMRRFWSFVPATSLEINQAGGLIRSIGVGEAPFFRQATFSLWQSETAMRDFAYKSPVHKQVVKLTRAENWYKEELFARFVPVASEGTWDGVDPLAEILAATGNLK